MESIRVAGSFRDPAGHVVTSKGRIFRAISTGAEKQYRESRDVWASLVEAGKLVAFTECAPSEAGLSADRFPVLLEHPTIHPWSMPYEWSFALMQEAAIFHLDLHISLLEQGFTLSDASAYNVQFIGPKPIFIDHLSIRPYRDGEFWLGHRQFCEQFLNPLLLRAYLDIAPNAWYRGNLEGIPVADMARLLPHRARLSWGVLANVILPARFQKGATSEKAPRTDLKQRSLPKVGYLSMLRQLRGLVAKLRPANTSATTWANYATTTTYDDQETVGKKTFIADFIRASRAVDVIDLGCNTGDYSQVCLEAGASRVTGFDFDQQSLDKAHARAKREQLNFLALFLDARNPSPTQGWMQDERRGFAQRFSADAVLALAFEHHLAIAHNAPLGDVVAWISGLAPRGVIEFVPKSDPTIQKMLALREDIFPDYTKENFERILGESCSVEAVREVSASGRTLYAFKRRR